MSSTSPKPQGDRVPQLQPPAAARTDVLKAIKVVHTIVWALFAGCILAIVSLCTQAAGETPGQCVLGDGMATLIQKIETADSFVLASPTNFYSVTALFKRFMERLLVYAY